MKPGIQHRFKFIVVVILLLFSSTGLATVYTTQTDGAWTSSGTWDNGVPGATDTIVVQDSVWISSNLTLRGHITIQAGGIITGNYELKLGDGDANKGELFNYGKIDIKKLKVKDDGSGTTGLYSLPIAHNYGTIINSDGMHVGHNNASSTLINYFVGVIYCYGELHLDHHLDNRGTFYLYDNLKNHGGTVTGCGNLTVFTVSFEENGSRPGTVDCINICDSNGSSTPTMTIGSNDYTSLNAAYTASLSSSDATLDQDSSLVCGLNESGAAVTLPVSYLYFKANRLGQMVFLEWATAMEENSQYFVLEKSDDGREFIPLDRVESAGYSDNITYYEYLDLTYRGGTHYYRLKQVDLDGEYAYSKVIVVNDGVKNSIRIYPNPGEGDGFRVEVSHTRDIPSHIRIISTDGKLVQSIIPTELSTEIQGLTSGIYTVICETADGALQSYGVIQK
jgi:hypothetical protein